MRNVKEEGNCQCQSSPFTGIECLLLLGSTLLFSVIAQLTSPFNSDGGLLIQLHWRNVILFLCNLISQRRHKCYLLRGWCKDISGSRSHLVFITVNVFETFSPLSNQTTKKKKLCYIQWKHENKWLIWQWLKSHFISPETQKVCFSDS